MFVIRVQNPQHVQRPLENRIWFVFELGHLEHHVQEVPRVAQIVVRIRVAQAHAVAIGEGRDGGHLGHQTPRLQLDRFGIEDVARFGVERGQRGHTADQDAHGVRIVSEPIQEDAQILMHERVMGDVERPLVQLLLIRQFAVKNEIGDFEEGGALGQLLDGIAAISQDALVAVNECDAAPARGRVLESGIIAQQAKVILADLDPPQIHGPNGAVFDWRLIFRPGAIVDDG